jgi:hypothetical protein
VLINTVGAVPFIAASQTSGSSPIQTVTADGLEIALLSFERAPSRDVSLGGACPPGGYAGTVQGTLKGGTILFTAKVNVKVLPTFKGPKEERAVLQDDKDQKYESDTRQGDWGNPGGSSDYECSLQFVTPDNVTHTRLQVGNAVLSLPKAK